MKDNKYQITVGGRTFDSHAQLCNHLNVIYSNETKSARRAGKDFVTHMQDKYGPVIEEQMRFMKIAGKFLYGHAA